CNSKIAAANPITTTSSRTGLTFMTTNTLQHSLRIMSPERRRYALISLPAHLAKAGQAERLRSTLTDLHYLEAKIALVGSEPAIGDYDLAITLPSPSITLELVQ